MTSQEAQLLRDRWRLMEDPPCEHPLSDVEYAEDGEATGNYVCTVCGMVVRARMSRHISR